MTILEIILLIICFILIWLYLRQRFITEGFDKNSKWWHERYKNEKERFEEYREDESCVLADHIIRLQSRNEALKRQCKRWKEKYLSEVEG